MSELHQNIEQFPLGLGTEPGENRLFTANFIFATLANFFNSFGSQMMHAVLPLYVLAIGGTTAQAGLVAGVLPITALILRPLAGWITDVWSRRSFALFGSSCYGIASVIYSLSPSIGTLIFGRMIHGVGICSYTTAANAYIVDIAPRNRHAEAIGLFSVTNSLGLIFGPAVGFYILSLFDYYRLYIFATILAIITCFISLFAKEKHMPQKSSRRFLSLRTGLLAFDALPIAWIALCLGLTMGAISTFIAIYAKSRGINNPGIYFTVEAVALLISRLFSGRLADRYGYSAAIIPGAIILAIALMILPLVHTLPTFLVSASLVGLGFGTAQPATMALLLEQTGIERRGLAVSTYFIGYDGGIFLGSAGSGLVSELWGFGVMWPLTAGCVLLGLLGLLKRRHENVVTLA